MTLVRLLIGGGGVFTPPAPTPVSPYVLNPAPDGAMNPWQTPAAYSHGGKTIYPWVDSSGNVEVGVFDEATKLVTGRYTIHAAFQADAHSSPTLLRRSSDGKILTVYSKHNDIPINIRVSTNADDPSAWSAATNLDSQLGATRYTDSQLHEYGGKAYLFWRDEPSAGTDSRWCLSINPDITTPTTGWPAQTIVYRVTSARSYVITALDAANGKLHFIATNGGATVGGIAGFSRLGHFYLDLAAGTYHKSDGTTITLPLTFSNLTTIYTGTAGVFATNCVVDGSGNLAVAAQDTISGAIRYIYIRSSGSTWSSTNVVAAGTGYEYSGSGTGFGAWGSCIEDADPDIMFAIRNIGAALPEVYSYDAGSGFAETQLTTASTYAYQQMICVRGNSTALQAMCQQGIWHTYTSYNVGIVGFGT